MYNTNTYFNNNRYFPYYGAYGQNYYQQPYFQQQASQMQQQSQQQPQVQTGPYQAPIQAVKFLTSDEMKAYIVLPGTSELLVDQSNKIVMLKSADMMGQSSSRTFNYNEFSAEDANQKEKETPAIDTTLFANKEDLKNFVTKDDLKAFTDKLDKMQKQIQINEILKGDSDNGK